MNYEKEKGMKSRKSKLAVILSMVMITSMFLSACGQKTENPGVPAETESETPTETGSGTTAEAGSEAPAEAGGEARKAFFIGPMAGGAAWGQAEKGFLDGCAKYGWEGQYLAPTTANAYSDMVNLIDTAITNGADILLCPVMEVDMWADTLDRAKEAGVTVIAVTADDPERTDAQIGTDPTSIGIAAAEALTEAMEGQEIYVATMQSKMTDSMAGKACEAFESRLKELDPDAVVVGALECDSNASKAQDNLAALKLSDPRLNSMISIDSYAGLGGAAFVEERGLQGEFYVIGMDDAPEILRCIQDGTMLCTIALNWYETGVGACDLAQTILEGGTVEHGNDAGAKALFTDDVEAWAEEKGIDLES